MDEHERTLTVTELNRAAHTALQKAFGGHVWVRGEVQRLVRSKPGHVYFDLVEKDDLRDRVRARVRVALFRDERRRVERRLREANLELTEDVEIRVAARPGVYVERGEFQLVVQDLDPAFTAGRLAADRDRLLRVLAAEGLLRANAAHALPPVPLAVGLVSSGGTSAYHDFVEELASSPYAWRVVHADVRVQGNMAPRRLARAVREVAACGVDVVVLVRGGGAKTDLAAYDGEPLARAIATTPVPVLTGIGHETDRTVADEVVHTAHKTPTACARALVELVDAFVERADRVTEDVMRSARGRVAAEQRRLLVAAQHAGRVARSACTLAERDLAAAARRVTRGAIAVHGRSRARLRTQVGRVRRAAPSTLRRAHAETAGRRERLGRAAPRRFTAVARDLDQIEARLRALDPRRVLERGYTITRDGGGRAVRSTSEVEAGDLLATELTDGTVRSTVVAASRAQEASRAVDP